MTSDSPSCSTDEASSSMELTLAEVQQQLMTLEDQIKALHSAKANVDNRLKRRAAKEKQARKEYRAAKQDLHQIIVETASLENTIAALVPEHETPSTASTHDTEGELLSGKRPSKKRKPKRDDKRSPDASVGSATEKDSRNQDSQEPGQISLQVTTVAKDIEGADIVANISNVPSPKRVLRSLDERQMSAESGNAEGKDEARPKQAEESENVPQAPERSRETSGNAVLGILGESRVADVSKAETRVRRKTRWGEPLEAAKDAFGIGF